MSKTLDGFNRIAWLYDILARMVFGGTLERAQRSLLAQVPDGANVLILGGGSGQVLVDLLSIKPGCRVTYAEASSVMITKAKRRLAKGETWKIDFCHGTVADIPKEKQFDVVVVNFFLDIFTSETVGQITRRAFGLLQPRGIFLACDFVEGQNWRQRTVLKLMYNFFRLTASIEAREMPPWRKIIEGLPVELIELSLFCGGFVHACAYRKINEVP